MPLVLCRRPYQREPEARSRTESSDLLSFLFSQITQQDRIFIWHLKKWWYKFDRFLIRQEEKKKSWSPSVEHQREGNRSGKYQLKEQASSRGLQSRRSTDQFLLLRVGFLIRTGWEEIQGRGGPSEWMREMRQTEIEAVFGWAASGRELLATVGDPTWIQVFQPRGCDSRVRDKAPSRERRPAWMPWCLEPPQNSVIHSACATTATMQGTAGIDQ